MIGTGHGGTGVDLFFSPAAGGELGGLRVEPKICELCGMLFFRATGVRECPRCAARLRRVAPIPASRGDQAKRRPAVFHFPHLPAAWEAWQRARDLTLTPSTKRKGPRMVLTPEERKRRREEWRKAYRVRLGHTPRAQLTPEERWERNLAQKRRWAREHMARKRALAKLATLSTTIH